MDNKFSDFMLELVETVEKAFERDNEILLINDIINIYNKKFKNYVHYANVMYLENEYIKKWNELFIAKPNNSILRFKPEHHIITVELFKYILELRERNEEDK